VFKVLSQVQEQRSVYSFQFKLHIVVKCAEYQRQTSRDTIFNLISILCNDWKQILSDKYSA